MNLPVPISQTPPGPAEHGVAITPSDSDLLTNATRYIYVGGTGDLTVILNGDTAPVTLLAVPAGMLPISASQVMETDTSATDLVALW